MRVARGSGDCSDRIIHFTSRAWHQQAHLWMLAAEKKGEPVLAVNSVQFNNEEARYIDVLLP